MNATQTEHGTKNYCFHCRHGFARKAAYTKHLTTTCARPR